MVIMNRKKLFELIDINFDMDNLQVRVQNKSPRNLGNGKTSPTLRSRNTEKFNKKPRSKERFLIMFNGCFFELSFRGQKCVCIILQYFLMFLGSKIIKK